MKLIVLYGPEKSGKTTTLKMVYEQLKPFNLSETYWFKYYDSNRAHLDFRDVLALDYAKITAIKVDYKYKDYSDCISQILDECVINKILSDKSKIKVNYDTIEKLVTKIKQIINDKKSDNTNTIYTIEELTKEIEKLEAIDPKKQSDINKNKEVLKCGKDFNNINGYKVGFVLEGDYGFVHYARHSRNLYEHLKQLIGCDTIICACSAKNVPFLRQPFLCVLFFIAYYILQNGHCSLQLLVVNSNRYNEQVVANRIVSLI